MTVTFVSPADRARRLREVYMRAYRGPATFDPLPHQRPPDGDWFFWLLEAGRGAGKTAASAHLIRDHLNGPPCVSSELPHRVSLIAPTLGDGIESAHLNDQALTRLEPGAEFRQSRGGSRVVWPNGSQVRIFGTHTREDIERLRAGGNRCMVWAEELAAWRYLEDAWQHMMFGLRLGPHPRIVASTTPKPRPDYLKIREGADTISHATTLENPNLNEEQRARLLDMYGDTAIGRQELYGQIIEEAEGAIWAMGDIDPYRFDDLPDPYRGRTVVAVDPPGGVTEAGIVAACLIPDCPCGEPRLPHFGVLDDASGKMGPERWGQVTVDTYKAWDMDLVVAETNYGGDMVEAVIRQADPTVPFKKVTASRGKRLRAEPVKALYEQGRVHHIGAFPTLESEMVLWVPDESDWSPNRLDALVWAITELSSRRGPRKKIHGWQVDGSMRKTGGI